MKEKPASQIKNHESRKNLFPAFLKLENRSCLIVGGGKVALRKAESLMQCEALIKLVSPTAQDAVKRLASKGFLNWIDKKFTEDDLDGVFIVFAATDDSRENKRVVDVCRGKGVLVNAVDAPELCDFFVPSVVRRKSLAIAISTQGKSPVFSRRLRKELEQIITDEYGEFVDILGRQRERVKQAVPDILRRRKIFEALAYSDILNLLKAGKRAEVKERIEECISSLPD